MAARRPPWWIVGLALAFLGYYLLLIYCDARRPEGDGIQFAFAGNGMIVTAVDAGEAGARAGIAPGDRILACNGQAIRSRFDWMVHEANVEVGYPLQLTVERGGVRAVVPLAFGWQTWTEPHLHEILPRLGVRLVQAVTLLLALIVVFKRPQDATARACAWVLATFGVLSIVLQYRFAAVWRSLGWLGAPLWLPFLSSQATGAILFAFFAVFPRVRLRSRALWGLAWLPLLLVLVPHASHMAAAVYRPDRLAAFHDRWIELVVVNVGYLAAALTVLTMNYRCLEDLNERRRVRVLAVGSIAGCATGSVFVLFIWLLRPSLALYESPGVSIGAVFLLVTPLAFTYAILRHRMFDVRLIIRQGVRYAVARGLLLSLVPLVVAGFAADVLAHRAQPIEDILAARGWVYAGLAAVAVAAHSQRRNWLDALDRRFFRERYDAQRLLKQVVEEVRAAGSIARVAPRVVARVEAALHPSFAALLVPDQAAGSFRAVASAPSGAAPKNLPTGARWAEVIAVLGRPLDVSFSEGDALAGRLPAGEVARLRDSRIEMLTPVTGEGRRLDAVLALGGKRSEEPYSQEDRDLLGTIADGLALLADRPQPPPAAAEMLAECPQCGACYGRSVAACAEDGSALLASRTPRVLAGRYRIDRRLRRGGMGTVYRALDTALDRQVAVKVVREDLVGRADMAARFQQEARTAATFSHPNVVTVHDFGIEGGSHAYLVMELLEGALLRDDLRRERRLPPPRVLSIMRDVTAAVDAAHRRHFVHRDLKPDNVFLVHSGEAETAKILDFGIARTLGNRGDGTTFADTEGASLVGTPQYMAPEQLRGGEPTPAWDLWAMAVMTYEMLTGTLPFSRFRVDATVSRLPGGYEAALQQSLEQAPAARAAFFRRAFAYTPADRPDSARAFLLGLERALQTSGLVRERSSAEDR
jgi:tRNA A-37 threonylcarbamoyl transferase component Bud32